MAKPTEHAPLICTILSIVALLGIIASLIWKTPLPAIILLLPTVVYEIYRTEGASTKISSVLIGLILILEIVLIVAKIDIDISKILGEDTKYIAGNKGCPQYPYGRKYGYEGTEDRSARSIH